MWRYLTGLNKTDLIEELRSVQVERLEIDDVYQNSFIKIKNINQAKISLIQRYFKNHELFFQSAANENENFDVIFSISSTSVNKFKKEIESEKGLDDLKKLLRHILTEQWFYSTRGKELKIGSPLIMGILNITPDSFSDGGKYFDKDKAYRHAVEMLDAGADMIDIGGESTRPGSTPVSIDEEWQRISGVINRLLNSEQCIISVDTYKSEVARRALDIGAHIINDISGLTFDPAMAEVVTKFQVPIILMHIKGTPHDMQKNPSYQNLMEEIYSFLEGQCQFARENGIDQIIVDPGIGFGKRPGDNYEIIRRLGEFKALGYPVLLGASRKSFIGFGLKDSRKDRTIGSITSLIYGLLNGAKIVRVHDVEETKQALQIVESIQNLKANS